MANGTPQSYRHLRIDGFGGAARFSSRLRVPGKRVPALNRQAHAGELRADLQGLEAAYQAEAAEWQPWEHIREKGLVLEIESVPGQGVDPTTLERKTYGFQLLNVRGGQGPGGIATQFSTWFVPDGRLQEFERLLAQYEGKTGDKGHRPLVDSIAHLRRAAAAQLWTEAEPWPADPAPFWFECWLRAPDAGTRDRVLAQFLTEAERVGIRPGTAYLRLQEHTIVMAFGTPQQFAASSALLACLSELRRGRDISFFIDALSVEEQAAWAADLSRRITPPPDDLAICLLDTGVNRGHPVLTGVLAEGDNQSIKPAEWGSGDDHPGDGHGTPMAGICLLGDVAAELAGGDALVPPAVLEAVKIVPPVALRNADEKAAAAYTAQGVAAAELHRPGRRRVWCMATTMDGPNMGIPSAWSAEIDQLAAGTDRDDRAPRLILLAAGNVPQNLWRTYPDGNFATSPQNPTQAWNALVVGGYTTMTGDPQLRAPNPPLVPPGSLAPCSPTSRSWSDNQWPYRPDVVFEAGNAERPPPGSDPLVRPDLQPLSLSADFLNGAFCSFGATSAAVAEGANFAARIRRQYADYRPETVRALICHSAQWTDEMWAQTDANRSLKQRCQQLLRTVGYGMPSLRDALETARSRVTLIAERALQPFHRTEGRVAPYQMDVFSLPWAGKVLTTHPEAVVRIKVTLSYFIEPNPGNRGYTSIYRYAGCQLRFRVSDPGQTRDDLVSAVSAAAQEPPEEGQEAVEAARFPRDPRWQIGPQAATRGSLHSDLWIGTAAEAADMRHIAIYPMTGWWKTRPGQGRVEATQPYSLIVTVESLTEDLDLYAEIAAAVAIANPVAV